jgi:signal transduction histidine kinase
LSNSTREGHPVISRQLSGERLAELISTVAKAPDFATGARFFVAQFADEIGAERACALLLNTKTMSLDVVATIGYESGLTVDSLSLDHEHDPLVISAMTMVPICCPANKGSWTQLGLTQFLAIPFPQPQSSQVPRFQPIEQVDRLSATPCEPKLGVLDNSAAARAGYSPCGVVVFDVECDEEAIASLYSAIKVAGPVLWRMSMVEEYKHSTNQLDEQSRLLTSIINSLPDPIVIINASHDIIVQNSRAEHLLSMKEDDSEGRRRAVEINNLLFTSHLSKAAMSRGATGDSRELNLVDPDEGTDLLFEVLTQPLDDAGEGATVSVLRDVTDLRRAAGELERQVQRVRLAEFDAKRERDRLNLILANVADPILVTDDLSNIILMNRQAELLFTNPPGGEGPDQAIRTSAVRSNDTKFTTFISEFTISSDVSRRKQMVLRVPNEKGKELPVEVVSGKILDRRGEPIAIVSVLHDLTKQVENERLYEELKKFSNELEARVRAATADLAEQNIRLQWQSRELEKANRLKSEFLASMSHELRTPINALIGYTALMLDRIYGALTEKQEEGLLRIQAAAHHLLALINDILDLAKIEAGRMPLHLEDVSLQDIVREINVQIDPLVKKKRLVYRCEIPEAPIPMHTDRIKVKQILLNLLSNAVKFTHTGQVTLSTEVDGNMVRIDVSDTGIGIREEDLEAIWEDFRQVDQSRTREFGGTGLGLSITRKLVGALGGTVSLRSIYGEGSTFSVHLPLRIEPRSDSMSKEGRGVIDT